MSMSEMATTVKERADASVEALTTALTEAREVAIQAQALGGEDPIPVNFIGIIHDYHYGKGEDDMPRHFFEVECDNGLWLHSACPSNNFDVFIKNTDIAVLDVGMLNGKVVEVRRVPSTGIVPIRLLGDVCGRDANKNFLYVGCMATYGDKRLEIVRQIEDNLVLGRYNDGSETKFATLNIVKLT